MNTLLIVILATIVIVVFISIQFQVRKENQKIREDLEKKNKEKKLAIENYNLVKSTIEMPEKCSIVHIKMSASQIKRGPNYIWRSEEFLHFFPTLVYLTGQSEGFQQLKFDVVKINLNEIQSFEKAGEIAYENKISGGGGGGSSIGKAVVGGVIAGGAGAIVASRNKNKDITSEFITHDKRECIMTILQNSKKLITRFEFIDYEVFKEILPEKEISLVDELKKRELIENLSSQKSNIIGKIRELGELKEEGLITFEEFEAKKKELLKNL